MACAHRARNLPHSPILGLRAAVEGPETPPPPASRLLLSRHRRRRRRRIVAALRSTSPATVRLLWIRDVRRYRSPVVIVWSSPVVRRPSPPLLWVVSLRPETQRGFPAVPEPGCHWKRPVAGNRNQVETASFFFEKPLARKRQRKGNCLWQEKPPCRNRLMAGNALPRETGFRQTRSSTGQQTLPMHSLQLYALLFFCRGHISGIFELPVAPRVERVGRKI